MAWTYILRCDDGSFYTGSTNGDLESRVWEHNNDEDYAARFTRKRRPVVLVYAEQFDTVDAAFGREKQIQGWSRAKKIALIELRGQDLPALSRSRGADASTSSATQHQNQPAPDASTSSATQHQANQSAGDASTSSATQEANLRG
ncbi:GIY-YIG nuclease family protein [Microbacterium sp. LBN7]|uniref:GIY-YIG nuclease family protein n=1 Tax=Microbacterium sp. LBN7 TaxID=3129773 RepID=UPI00324CB0B2